MVRLDTLCQLIKRQKWVFLKGSLDIFAQSVQILQNIKTSTSFGSSTDRNSKTQRILTFKVHMHFEAILLKTVVKKPTHEMSYLFWEGFVLTLFCIGLNLHFCILQWRYLSTYYKIGINKKLNELKCLLLFYR